MLLILKAWVKAIQIETENILVTEEKNIDLGVVLCLNWGSWLEVSVFQPLGHDHGTFTQGSTKTTVKHRYLYCDLYQ